MKTLKQFINEGIINIKDYRRFVKPRVTPKDKKELRLIVKDTIEKEGNRCDLNFIDTSKITDMNGLFANSKFNGDISKWDVSNVTDMGSMFMNSKFNGDISNWDVSNVKDMFWMFCGSKFNGNISKWDVSKVKNMWRMFANSKFNGDISKWDISNKAEITVMFSNSLLEKTYGRTPSIDKDGHFVNIKHVK